MHFVLLDDDETAAMAVAWALEAFGNTVAVAHTSKRCFSILFGQDIPDVVILDITLADTDGDDGIAISRKVRHRWPNLPIILATGHEMYPGLREVLRDPRTKCIQKPYEIADLITTAREMLRARDRQTTIDRAAVSFNR